MARRRSKKKSNNKLLKTVILLVLFIGLWFIYNHTDIPARIQNALRPHKSTTVQTAPEPEVTPTKPQTGILPSPRTGCRSAQHKVCHLHDPEPTVR